MLIPLGPLNLYTLETNVFFLVDVAWTKISLDN